MLHLPAAGERGHAHGRALDQRRDGTARHEERVSVSSCERRKCLAKAFAGIRLCFSVVAALAAQGMAPRSAATTTPLPPLFRPAAYGACLSLCVFATHHEFVKIAVRSLPPPASVFPHQVFKNAIRGGERERYAGPPCFTLPDSHFWKYLVPGWPARPEGHG